MNSCFRSVGGWGGVVRSGLWFAAVWGILRELAYLWRSCVVTLATNIIPGMAHGLEYVLCSGPEKIWHCESIAGVGAVAFCLRVAPPGRGLSLGYVAGLLVVSVPVMALTRALRLNMTLDRWFNAELPSGADVLPPVWFVSLILAGEVCLIAGSLVGIVRRCRGGRSAGAGEG